MFLSAHSTFLYQIALALNSFFTFILCKPKICVWTVFGARLRAKVFFCSCTQHGVEWSIDSKTWTRYAHTYITYKRFFHFSHMALDSCQSIWKRSSERLIFRKMMPFVCVAIVILYHFDSAFARIFSRFGWHGTSIAQQQHQQLHIVDTLCLASFFLYYNVFCCTFFIVYVATQRTCWKQHSNVCVSVFFFVHYLHHFSEKTTSRECLKESSWYRCVMRWFHHIFFRISTNSGLVDVSYIRSLLPLQQLSGRYKHSLCTRVY